MSLDPLGKVNVLLALKCHGGKSLEFIGETNLPRVFPMNV